VLCICKFGVDVLVVVVYFGVDILLFYGDVLFYFENVLMFVV